MTIRTVFVGGVHGVGKSYFCKHITRRLEVDHITASELIGRYVKHKKDKTVLNIEKNQLILAEELSRYQTSSKTILLDGHFCLLDKKSCIQDVPLETFKAISPHAIILLIDKPKSVAERLSDRDKRIHNINSISELQSREIDRAEFISQCLEIPITIVKVSDEIEKSISKVIAYL